MTLTQILSSSIVVTQNKKPWSSFPNTIIKLNSIKHIHWTAEAPSAHIPIITIFHTCRAFFVRKDAIWTRAKYLTYTPNNSKMFTFKGYWLWNRCNYICSAVINEMGLWSFDWSLACCRSWCISISEFCWHGECLARCLAVTRNLFSTRYIIQHFYTLR